MMFAITSFTNANIEYNSNTIIAATYLLNKGH